MGVMTIEKGWKLLVINVPMPASQVENKMKFIYYLTMLEHIMYIIDHLTLYYIRTLMPILTILRLGVEQILCGRTFNYIMSGAFSRLLIHIPW